MIWVVNSSQGHGRGAAVSRMTQLIGINCQGMPAGGQTCPEQQHGGVGENDRLMNINSLPPGNTTEWAIMTHISMSWQVLAVP